MTKLEKLEHRLAVERLLAEAKETTLRMKVCVSEKKFAMAASYATDLHEKYRQLDSLIAAPTKAVAK